MRACPLRIPDHYHVASESSIDNRERLVGGKEGATTGGNRKEIVKDTREDS